jgi:hypothetical protein
MPVFSLSSCCSSRHVSKEKRRKKDKQDRCGAGPIKSVKEVKARIVASIKDRFLPSRLTLVLEEPSLELKCK